MSNKKPNEWWIDPDYDGYFDDTDENLILGGYVKAIEKSAYEHLQMVCDSNKEHLDEMTTERDNLRIEVARLKDDPMAYADAQVMHMLVHDNEQLKLTAERYRTMLVKTVDALDKSLPAGTWFHKGPYGASPEVEDYEYACEVFREGRKALEEK